MDYVIFEWCLKNKKKSLNFALKGALKGVPKNVQFVYLFICASSCTDLYLFFFVFGTYVDCLNLEIQEDSLIGCRSIHIAKLSFNFNFNFNLVGS